jgi:hypothetical protein
LTCHGLESVTGLARTLLFIPVSLRGRVGSNSTGTPAAGVCIVIINIPHNWFLSVAIKKSTRLNNLACLSRVFYKDISAFKWWCDLPACPEDTSLLWGDGILIS